eukprot:680144-Lingulodinium_polyedra.AAC.1
MRNVLQRARQEHGKGVRQEHVTRACGKGTSQGRVVRTLVGRGESIEHAVKEHDKHCEELSATMSQRHAKSMR